MARLTISFALGLTALFAAIFIAFKMPNVDRLDDAARVEIVARIRSAIEKSARTPQPGAWESRATPGLVVALYYKGVPSPRVEVHAKDVATLGAQVKMAGEKMAAELVAAALDRVAQGRLKVDVVLAEAPLLLGTPLSVLGLPAGLEGAGIEVGTRSVFATPDDLMRSDLLSAHSILPELEFHIGFDERALISNLSSAASVTAEEWRALPHRFFRFREDAFIEPADRASQNAAPKKVLTVVRGATEGPEPTAAALREGALAGGRYLVHHERSDGSFDYEYYTLNDTSVDGDYSMPRHAGTTAFLAQLFADSHDPAFGDAARAALTYLEQRGAACGKAGFPMGRCVASSVRPISARLPPPYAVDLGSSALALVAVSAWPALDRSDEPNSLRLFADGLARFIELMQQPNGDFLHIYRPGRGPDPHDHRLYYSGEATLALARFATLPSTDSKRAAELTAKVVRALDFLTVTQYAHLAGQFAFGEDHWTCQAADAIWPRLGAGERDRYAHFCDQFSAFLRRTQFRTSDGDAPDMDGAYGLSPILPPHSTPVGSRTEATLSSYNMDLALGNKAEADLARGQIISGLRYLLGHQLRPDNTYLAVDPDRAIGGILFSDVNRYIRIDTLQHSCAAMLRASHVL